MFQFKTFQREDYARGALHDGLILGHDTGGGKTIALYTWPALKVGFQTGFAPGEPRGLHPLEPVLLVVPGDLHQQTITEGEEKFKVKVTRLDSQDTFLRLSRINPVTGRRELPPGYYMTSYTELASNGVSPFPELQRDNPVGMMQILGLTDDDSGEYFDTRESLHEKEYKMLYALPTMTLAEIERCCTDMQRSYEHSQAMQTALANARDTIACFHCHKTNPGFSDLPPDKKAIVRERMVAAVHAEYTTSIGTARWVAPLSLQPSALSLPVPSAPTDAPAPTAQPAFKLKCVYSPSLADLCQDTFAACAVDEGVKMKGEDTIIGTGVRQINARYKLVLTATPIKNRLPDVFRLAWWASGARPDAHARFPYPDSARAREEFAQEFLTSERSIDRDKPQRFRKLTPQVCNVHRLWKMFAPVILRRRKADFGEDIVPKQRHVVRAPLGTRQAAVYRFHLQARYRDKHGRPAIGAQLQALRVAAANPASEMLIRPENDLKTPGEPRSDTPYIPKLHAALKLIHTCLQAGEQVVVFSAFHDSLDALAARLTESGVPHCVLDGRTSQKRRGMLASQFKQGPERSPYQVMVAGVECMSEGHSFPLCNNVILLCYSWAYDKFEQAINRVHRLNSRWPVKVHPIICERSIDRKLEALIQEKGDAAELVLDGHLIGEQSTDVNLAELLDIARKEFEEGGDLGTVDETELEKEWPPLRSDLATAARAWRNRGLELIGLPEPSSSPQPQFNPIPITTPEPTPELTPEPQVSHQSHKPHASHPPIPATPPSATPVTLFAGLPLFDLVA